MDTRGHLTNLQLELLKVFQYELPDNQLLEIKTLLSAYFANKATSEMDKLWDEKNWNQETMKNWLDTDLRKENG